MKWLRRWWKRLLFLLAVLGPGFITANVDNDAGGIYTYSLASARYGYDLLWTLIPMTVALVVIQEMCARMGAVTGKGLSDLIREEFGFRITFFMMGGLVLANFTNVMAEFAGVAASLEIFGLTRYISVPAAAVLIWVLVVYGDYKSVEKVFLIASGFYIAYIVSGVLARPNWHVALINLGKPVIRMHLDYVVMTVALIGTTIAPWMQFYLQAAVVEKGVQAKQYAGLRLEVIVGSIFTDVVAFFIMVACAATLYAVGHTNINDAAEAAAALRPLAGEYAAALFAFGLFNASLFAASILPLSTAYSVCEGLGVESGVNKKFREAPWFYWLYTLLVGAGAGIVLWPKLPLVKVIFFSQVVNGVLLPFVLIFMLLLINRKDLMGEFTNSRTQNIVAWSTVIVVIVLTIVLVVASFMGVG
jgi:NRAMP (natural resistance-associated macrophage protein)-like metal ion transporter